MAFTDAYGLSMALKQWSRARWKARYGLGGRRRGGAAVFALKGRRGYLHRGEKPYKGEEDFPGEKVMGL